MRFSKRRHWLEFEDLPWLPRAWRDMVTSLLHKMHAFCGLHQHIANQIIAVTTADEPLKIVDLGAGGGGPTLNVMKEMHSKGQCGASAMLTDIRPNQNAIRSFTKLPWINYYPESVDAGNVPASLHGVRTMNASFHHLREDDAKRVLRNAYDARQPILITEITTRTWLGVASCLPAPLYAFLLAPFTKPKSRWDLIWVYLIPIVPLILLWDGIASCMRSYMPADLERLVADLDGDHYEWDIGMTRLGRLPVKVPYLVGKPKTGVGSRAKAA